MFSDSPRFDLSMLVIVLLIVGLILAWRQR